MIRMIACDLDGTLLDDNAALRPQSARILRRMWEYGIGVVLTTGRSWRTAWQYQRQLGIPGPIIAHNGAYVFNPAEPQDLYRHGIPVPRAREFFGWADRQGIMLRGYLGFNRPVVFNCFDAEHKIRWRRPEDTVVPDIHRTLSVEPLEVFLLGDREVDLLLEQFGLSGPDYELVVLPRGSLREVNICAPGVTKAEGLQFLSTAFGVPSRSILALGDGLNDVEMLEWAGTSVAIGDGVAAAKAVSDYVTPARHPEPVMDGIRWALQKGLFGNRIQA